MMINSFKDILAWQKSHSLVLNVYELSEHFPKKEDFCLTNQVRRAAVSIASNIAEGFKRQTKNDSIHFYNIAEASLEEAKYQMLLAKDLKYITEEQYITFEQLSNEAGKVLCGWIKSQKSNV